MLPPLFLYIICIRNILSKCSRSQTIGHIKVRVMVARLDLIRNRQHSAKGPSAKRTATNIWVSKSIFPGIVPLFFILYVLWKHWKMWCFVNRYNNLSCVAISCCLVSVRTKWMEKKLLSSEVNGFEKRYVPTLE